MWNGQLQLNPEKQQQHPEAAMQRSATFVMLVVDSASTWCNTAELVQSSKQAASMFDSGRWLKQYNLFQLADACMRYAMCTYIVAGMQSF